LPPLTGHILISWKSGEYNLTV